MSVGLRSSVQATGTGGSAACMPGEAWEAGPRRGKVGSTEEGRVGRPGCEGVGVGGKGGSVAGERS